jgi:hypothetical protein
MKKQVKEKQAKQEQAKEKQKDPKPDFVIGGGEALEAIWAKETFDWTDTSTILAKLALRFGSQRLDIIDIHDFNVTKDSVFETVIISKGQSPIFPADFYNLNDSYSKNNALSISNEGKVPEKILPTGEEIFIPTYKIANAIDWSLEYEKNARVDILKRAFHVFLRGFKDKINNDKLRLLIVSGQMKKRNKPINGFAKLYDNFIANNKRMTHMIVSKKLFEKIKNRTMAKHSNLKYHEVSPKQMPEFTSLNECCSVELIVNDQITDIYYELIKERIEKSKRYLKYWYNIKNFFARLFGKYKKEIAIGLDLQSKDFFTQVVSQKLHIFEDPTLHRRGRHGIYGWLELGLACWDADRIALASFPVKYEE